MKATNSIPVFCSIIFTIFLGIGSTIGQVIFVSQNATGSGSSWLNATGDLRTAMSLANAGEEIWISGGTYTPTTCAPCTFTDRDTRFVLPKGVKMRGGFVGTEGSLNERMSPQTIPDPSRDVFLSGQIEAGVDSNRSFTVLESIAPTAGTLVDQVHFVDGLANDNSRGSTNRGASGALIYVTSFDTLQKIELEIKHSSFQSGSAIGYGGGIFIDADFDKESIVLIENCAFNSNAADLGGGGLAISSSFGGADFSTIRDSDFSANVSGIDGGGGVLIRTAEGGRSMAKFINSTFTANSSADGDGGGLRLYGKGGFCSAILQNCDFESNSARFGGGLNIDAGYNGVAQPILTDCEFTLNESGNAGAAIYVSAIFGGVADYKVYKSIFDSNLSGESGGAILVNAIEGSSRPLYRDCRFTRNEATLYGGAVYNLGKSGVCSPTFINCIIADNKASSAGGVYCLGSENGESSPTILNCVFEGNEALVGGALYSNANDATGTAEPFVVNTVFFNNHADNGRTLRIIHGRPHLLNCYIDELDCPSLNSGFGGEPVCLGGNQFNLADVFDRTLSPYAYRALTNAPIIDAGSDSALVANQVFKDLLEDVRFRGLATDIGPNERSSDPILWEVVVDSTSISACEGSEVTLDASIYPPYPMSDISWIVGSDTVNQGTSYIIGELAESQTIRVSGHVFGESRSVDVTISSIPTIYTSLRSNMSSLPDTLCKDSTYQLTGIIDASGANYSVKWFDENDTNLSETELLTLLPTTPGTLFRKVEVTFDGTCLDTNSRAKTFNFEVANCMTSYTGQVTENKALTVFPNPTKAWVSIDGLTGNNQFPVTIYNSMGQDVYSGMISASHTTLNVYSLPQGLYSLIVRDEQTIYRVLLEKL